MRPRTPCRRSAGLALTVVAALSAVLAGCLPTASARPSTTTPAPPSESPSAAAASPSAVPSPSPAASPTPPSPSTGIVASGDPTMVTVRLEPVADGLSAPLLATGTGDGSGRVLVVEQNGAIRVVDQGRLLPEPFLDISKRISAGGERGLLGLAFHPGFDGSRERRFYVDYTNPDGNTVVAAYQTVQGAPDRADPASEQVLLRVEQPYANHNGGGLAFGPDGDLYIAMGDGGSAGDPQGNGQRLDTRLGKLLRIDVDGRTGDLPYGIPPSNPFAGRASAAPEIWSFGLRNPWRFSFDLATGDLWIGDVGQGSWEEIDRAPVATGGGRGADFGWNRMEGTHCYSPAKGCPTEGLQLPIAEYGHDQGCSVTGGYVYRGTASPALAGVYLFGDYCSGRVWGLASGGPDRQDPVLLAETGRTISSFGQDDAGELYVTDLAGGVLLRVVAEPR